MRPHVRCRLAGSSEQLYLGRGDWIGRAEHAALCLDDPRISEAHAMISLRGDALVLLALRGRFRVNRKVQVQVALQAGLEVELCEGVVLICEEVILPDALTGVRLPGLPRVLLTHTTTAFLDPPRVQPGYDPEGDIVFWTVGEHWSASVMGAAPQPVRVGDVLTVRGQAVEIVAFPIGAGAQVRTRQTNRRPLRLEVTPGGVRVTPLGTTETARITGIPGKILAALARQETAQPWREIVSAVWPDDRALESSLRRRLDVGVSRLRDRLQQLDAPGDLIALDGAGTIQLHLIEEDEVLFLD